MSWTLSCLVSLAALGCVGNVAEVASSKAGASTSFAPPSPDVLDEGNPVTGETVGHEPPDAGTPAEPDAGCVKPTAANTGIPPGTALTLYDKGLTLKEDNAIISGVEVKGSVTIAANNVTLRNSRIHGNIVIAPGRKNAVIDHCNIGPDTGTFLDAIPELVQAHDFQLLHSDLHNFVAGVRTDSNAYVFGNYMHDYNVGGNRSVVGIGAWGTYGPGNITIACNNIDLADPAPGTPSQEVNAVVEIICTDTSKPLQGLIMNNNWFSGGGYAVYAWGFWTTLQVTNNVWDGTAAYGPFDHNAETPLVWSGNTYADGRVLKSPGVNSTGTNCHN